MISFKYTSEEENYYLKTFYEKLSFIRLVLYGTILMNLFFIIIDYSFIDTSLSVFLIVRIFINIPLTLIIILLSYNEIFYKIHQVLLTILFTITGIGIIVLFIFYPTDFSYYGGLFIVFAIGYFLLGIRWEYATIGSTIILILFIYSSILYLDGFYSQTILFTIMYSTFLAICVYSSNKMESYNRTKFINEEILNDSNAVLTKRVKDREAKIEESQKVSIYSIAILAEVHDNFSGEHLKRVGNVSREIAIHTKESVYVRNEVSREEYEENIEFASSLHDIGKVGVSAELLNKKGKLNAAEKRVMQKHTKIGYDILKKIKEKYTENIIIDIAMDISHYHHENWDGSGYPFGLKGEEIPLSARIVSIADVYDALISKRPYKNKIPKKIALEEIVSLSGKKFDPYLIEVFQRVVKKL